MGLINDIIEENRKREVLDAVKEGKEYVKNNFCDKIGKMYIDGFIDGLEYLKDKLIGKAK